METDEYGRTKKEPVKKWNWSVIFMFCVAGLITAPSGWDYIYNKISYEEEPQAADSVLSSWDLMLVAQQGYRGYNWTGTAWQVDNGINASLPTIESSSPPTIVFKNGTAYMILGGKA